MSDLFPERLEPLAGVREPLSQPAGRDSGSKSRRKPVPPAPEEDAVPDVENDDPPHQVDRMA